MTGLRLYQTVHVSDGKPRLVGAHAALLAEAARMLFGCGYAPDIRQLERRIAAVARAERYPSTVSGFVRIEVADDGTERLLPAGLSFYKGYALRSLTPDARVVRCEIPFADLPTSAREAVHELANCRARSQGADIALLADGQGFCRTVDNAPLFAVRGSEVVVPPAGSLSEIATAANSSSEAPADPFSEPEALQGSLFAAPTFRSVERDVAAHAVRALGLTLREAPIRSGDLGRYDELFYVDHRGVTALAHCGERAYMSLTAERVADEMERMFA